MYNLLLLFVTFTSSPLIVTLNRHHFGLNK